MMNISNNQTIELVSTKCPNYEVFIHVKEQNDLRHCYCNIYAHGKLEDDLKYDILNIINVDKFPSIDFNGVSILDIQDGVYSAMVVGGSICRAYIWNVMIDGYKITKGIVCYNDDEDAIKFAEEKYKEKNWWV